MKREKWKLLQLFAEGGAGEGSAPASESGENGADAGHQRLLELGVPASKLRNRAYRAAQPPARQDAAAEETKGETGRLTWDQIKADPEYSSHLQNMVRSRLKNVKQAEDDLAKLTPALQTMARSYGLDPEKLDYDALSRAITSDARHTRSAPDAPQESRLQAHYQSLLRQGQALQQKYPGFDLHKELQNPAFARLTAPNAGISVEDAYYTVHRKGIEQAALQTAAQNTARQISNAIRAGINRPAENGTSAHGPSVTAFDYRNATREQREALKQRIRQAGARGEKIYPGSI